MNWFDDPNIDWQLGDLFLEISSGKLYPYGRFTPEATRNQ